MVEERRTKGRKAAPAKRAAKATSMGASRGASRTKKADPRARRAKARGAKPKAGATKTTVRKRKPRVKDAAPAAAPKVAAKRPRVPRTKSRVAPPDLALRPLVAPSSSEEEFIESVKYAAPAARRVFEEERFVFPETYGENRVRLLVKDPQWLFAHWDVNPETLAGLGGELGPRAAELSKLTLKVFDPANGGESVILLPGGVRSWYIRADSRRRAYRAELGVTLPSGEFRVLAESNTVVTPRVGPSHERASRVLHYRQGRALPMGAGLTAAQEDLRSAAGAGEWSPVADRIAPASPGEWLGSSGGVGGASESFGPGRPEAPGGASDVHRR
jgi:hypothetical protein